VAVWDFIQVLQLSDDDSRMNTNLGSEQTDFRLREVRGRGLDEQLQFPLVNENLRRELIRLLFQMWSILPGDRISPNQIRIWW
jgi:hypothetical protein